MADFLLGSIFFPEDGGHLQRQLPLKPQKMAL
jgi:hypothetical protein